MRMRIGINGAGGKMGKRIAVLASVEKDIMISAALEAPSSPVIGKKLSEVTECSGEDIVFSSSLEKKCADIDCLIDFTSVESSLSCLDICCENNIGMVIGTTGFTKEEEEKIRIAAEKIPIVFSPNMAEGVNVLFDIARRAAGVLKDDFSIKLDETHHVHKKDSPSGTAKMIQKVIKSATEETIPVKAARMGEVIGIHGIIFENEFEKLEIRHNAKSRDVFAAGAIKAAKFVFGKKPGLYSMRDVLGLEKQT
ncbi:MAG: 4-hydroxy-tetrahydrodipicolinate reductase [Candidatus Omnitrophica bacterium]|nr:4-hydroxy-tetrahydrodipicolinate reductase [Candidatus Omnitrophota bacterium]